MPVGRDHHGQLTAAVGGNLLGVGQHVGLEVGALDVQRGLVAHHLQQLDGVRAELGGVTSPVQAVQRLEGALQSFTGTREISGKPMLEYFAPLQAWLKQQNAGKQCGW